MKSNFGIWLSFGVVMLGVTSTQATSCYWDNTSPIEAAGFGTAGGTWGTEAKWSTSNAGGVTPGTTATTTSDPLNFGTTANGLASGTITVSGPVIGKSITVGSASGAITLSGGTITMDQISNGSFISVNSASTLTIGSNLDFGTGGSYRNFTGTITVNGNITGSGTSMRIINAGGNLTLGNVATTVGVSINAGTTIVGANNLTWGAIQNEGGTGAAGVLDVNGNNLTVSVLQGGGKSSTITDNATGSGTSTLTITYAGFSYFAQNITLADGATRKVAITKKGTGNHGLSTANTYSGNTLVSQGTLTLRNNLAIQNSAIDTSGAGKFAIYTGITTATIGGLIGSQNLSSVFDTTYSTMTAITLNTVTDQSLTYSGNITDGATGMTLTKTGAGTQVLSGANTYTGATAVDAGTLLVNGSLASGSAVTVNSGGSLGGTGVVSGTVAVNANGALCPGITASDTQTLTISNTLTFADSSSTCQMDVATSASDLVIATGDVALNNATLNLNGTLAAASYVILRTSGTLSGTFNGLADGAAIPSTGYYIHYVTSGSPNYIVLNQSATPVVLLQLQALTLNGKVTVRWSTSSESKTAGFDLYRVVNGQPEKLNDTVIAAKGWPNGGIGASYSVADAGAQPGQTYTYKLVERTTDGQSIDYGPYDRTVSEFVMKPLEMTAAGAKVRWLSRAGESYRVLKSTDLTSGQYQPIAENIAATPPENEYLDAAPGNSGFYRIELQP